MKQINPALASHLQTDVTTLATCWQLKRRDGLTLGFTDHDVNLTIEGVTYHAASGFTPTAIAGSSSLAIDNLDIEGLLDSSTITEDDLHKGLYDYAEIAIFQVNYHDISQGIIPLRTGWLGEIAWHGEQCIAEIQGLTHTLSQNIGSLFSPTCRAAFGDARCGVDINAHTVSGTLTSAQSRTHLFDSMREEPAHHFTNGVITFTSGQNQGVSVEIKSYQSGGVRLALPLPAEPAIGDNYTMTAGCNKHFNTCRDRFSNVINFRGEPHIPGLDRMLETAGTRRNASG